MILSAIICCMSDTLFKRFNFIILLIQYYYADSSWTGIASTPSVSKYLHYAHECRYALCFALVVAERVGFEPTVAKGDTRSPGAPVRPLQHLSQVWRRGWDSNPRGSTPTAFRERLHQPLGHLSSPVTLYNACFRRQNLHAGSRERRG